MPRPDLEAIRARLAAATPGPWYRRRSEPRDVGYVATRNPRYDAGGPLVGTLDTGGMRRPTRHQRDIIFPELHADAEMIAHAPADLAALLAYIAELEPIVRDVAEAPYASHEDDTHYCTYCEQEEVMRDDGRWSIQHAPDCPVSRSRALAIPPAKEASDG